MEEEVELGPDAAAAAKPRAAPCALRGGGRGRGGGAVAARARSLPKPRARSHPGRREIPARSSLPRGRGRQRARWREARGRRSPGSGLEPHWVAGAASRQTERESAPALIRAIGNPLARLPWFPPRAPLAFTSPGPFSPRLEPEE